MDLLLHEPLVHTLGLPHRPPVYDFKTTLECLDLAPLMIGMQQLQIYWFKLCVERISVLTLKGKDTIPFRSQKRSSKVSTKRVLRFPLNTM